MNHGPIIFLVVFLALGICRGELFFGHLGGAEFTIVQRDQITDDALFEAQGASRYRSTFTLSTATPV